ncbi:divisome protein SepX/GlpR [Nakamurella sp. GG22]
MNIPTSLIVVLLVIAWLVVLVPMVARRRERVPQVEPAGSGFRVLRRASASLRRRPARGPKGRMMSNSDQVDDGTHAGPEDELVAVGAENADAQPADAAEEWAAAQSSRPRRVTAGSTPFRAPQQLDDRGADSFDDATTELETTRVAVDVEQDRPIDRPQVPDEIDEQEWSDHVAAAPVGTPSAETDDVELRPVPRRPGRGGFDPEAAEATRAYRYQQRRRVALILLIATVAFSVLALVLVNWLWVGAAVSLTLLVGYLSYLRRQVRIEAAIRQRRMERLQRARQIRPEYQRAPRRTRGGLSAVVPGRTVVDLDDDDPAFDELDPYHEPMAYRRAAGQ